MRDFFWGEFDLAELHGSEKVKALAETLYQKYKNSAIDLTDLVMVINHKSWVWHDLGNDDWCEIYADLYYKYYERAIEYLESQSREDDLTYFIRTLD